jgi:hypothetical protein
LNRFAPPLANALRKALSLAVRFAPVRAVLAAWYRLSLKALAWMARSRSAAAIRAIYVRHQNWILGISDIDLIILIDDPDPASDRQLFVNFWRRYIPLRLLFPMLCGVSEIRWIPTARLPAHPLHRQPEVRLLLNPEQWRCVFHRAAQAPAQVPVFDPPAGGHLPLTMFLEFNLYGYLQRQLFAAGKQPGLRLERMAKCAAKILQHIHYLRSDEYLPLQVLQQRMRQPEAAPWPRYAGMLQGLQPQGALNDRPDRAAARAVYDLILELSRVHEELLEAAPPAVELRHAHPPAWAGTRLEAFLRDAEQRFGDRVILVGFHSPYKRYHVKLFQVLTPATSFDDFFDFVVFAKSYQAGLQAEKVFLNATTPALLSSQFYTLWGHVALEAHILRAQTVYAPRGGFRLRLPETRWTLQKIRESVAVFEEFYLPFLASPLARGEGMDFCKIYERAETEMLFHYYCYLKHREDYLDVLRRSGGDADEVIAYGCARYGSEIGIRNWHPLRFIDSYPYLKAMIRQVDEMALRQLENPPSSAKSSS